MLETFYCAITVTTAFIGVDMEITNYIKSIASCSVSKTCYYIYYYKNTGFFFCKIPATSEVPVLVVNYNTTTFSKGPSLKSSKKYLVLCHLLAYNLVWKSVIRTRTEFAGLK